MKTCESGLLTWVLAMLASVAGLAQTDIYDSGGPLMPEQAGYDVTHYDLRLAVNPADSTILGTVTIQADIVQPIEYFVLDLDTLLQVRSIREVPAGSGGAERRFERRVGKIWVDLRGIRQPGERITVAVAYGGRPRIAPRPPWDGGFTWARTPSGAPWIATTCQSEGADIWWPCKDHVSDEPDSMDLHISVPGPLVVASNGRLRGVEKDDNGRSTYHWHISTPINIYNVALNIAPYQLIESQLQSVAGDTFPVKFWVLPENYADGQRLMAEILQDLKFFEKTLGPYPFRIDKYGAAQTPHLGMEHQSIIAYGANFSNGSMTGGKDWGFDALLHHESSHEWWGNLVTNADWKDMWIHEGFGTYMQALYMQETKGDSGYHAYMASLRNGADSPFAIAPRTSQTSNQIYRAPIYAKGAWVLHTLRYLIGEQTMRTVLRRMAYPAPEMEALTGGRQCRFVSTSDFIRIAEKYAGRDLEWFFDVYVRQPELPELVSNIDGEKLTLRWQVPDDLPFPMPVDLEVEGKTRRVELSNGAAVLRIKKGSTPNIDPQNWLLKARAYPPVVAVEPEILQTYVGKYQLMPNFIVTIRLEGGQLLAQVGRQPEVKIYPASEFEFFARIANTRLRFVRNPEGTVDSLKLLVRTREMTAQRIE